MNQKPLRMECPKPPPMGSPNYPSQEWLDWKSEGRNETQRMPGYQPWLFRAAPEGVTIR